MIETARSASHLSHPSARAHVTGRSPYHGRMRFLWAMLAISPFVAAAIGMLTGRVRARSCCAVPAEHDSRLKVTSRP